MFHDPHNRIPGFVAEWIKEPSGSIVREMRDYTGYGMMTCKSYLEKEAFEHKLTQSLTVDELRKCVKILATKVTWNE